MPAHLPAHACRSPNTLAEKQAGWKAPWLCEAKARGRAGQSRAGTARAAAVQQPAEGGVGWQFHWTQDRTEALTLVASALAPLFSLQGVIKEDQEEEAAGEEGEQGVWEDKDTAAEEGSAAGGAADAAGEGSAAGAAADAAAGGGSGGAAAAAAEVEGELEDEAMHWSMDIIAVRCVEKMLDLLAGGFQGLGCAGGGAAGRHAMGQHAGGEQTGRAPPCLLISCLMCRSCRGHGETQLTGIHITLSSSACSACSACALLCSAGKLGEAAGWAGEVPSPGLALQALRRARPVLLDMQHRAASEASKSGWEWSVFLVHVVCALCRERTFCSVLPIVFQTSLPGAAHVTPPPLPACLQADSSRRGGRGGQFAPQWPVEAHFSREYLQELLTAVDAALEGQVDIKAGGGAGLLAAAAAAGEGGQPAAKKQRRAQQAQEEAAAAAPGVQPCLLTAGAHAAYAGSSVEEREQLVKQADAMLDAAAGATSAAGQGAPVPALSELPPAVLRSHWLLRLQLEWEAGAAETLSLPLLAKRRQQRRWVGDWSNLVGATSADSQFCDAGPAPVVARLPHYLTAPLVA